MPFLCECSYQLIVHLCRETLVESREFHGDRDRRLAFFVDESQRFEGGFYDAGNEFRLLLDQLIWWLPSFPRSSSLRHRRKPVLENRRVGRHSVHPPTQRWHQRSMP